MLSGTFLLLINQDNNLVRRVLIPRPRIVSKLPAIPEGMK